MIEAYCHTVATTFGALPITLVTSSKLPGLYAPMIHHWSSTDNVSSADRQYLYWNLSTWDDYQVKLMRTHLTKV